MKDFDGWNEGKKGLENTNSILPIFHEREIWWCSLGLNIGSEQDGKNDLFERPVLVLKKFNTTTCWVLPMSSKSRHDVYFYNTEHMGVISSVRLSQLRLVSVKRFRRLVREISPYEFSRIKEKIINILGAS